MQATVEAVSDKFNGGLKLNGEWLSFDKSYTGDKPSAGTVIEFETKDNKWKGKTYKNIVSLKLVAQEITPVKKVTATHKTVSTNGSRDFDKEARGKTRCQMFSAALQSPVLQQYFYAKEQTLEQILETVRQVADNGVEYTFDE